MQQTVLTAVERIRQMEAVFDFLQTAGADAPGYRAQLQTLLGYYESPLWLHDYDLDGQGLLPEDLKRGVLSEDGVYNLLSELDRSKKA